MQAGDHKMVIYLEYTLVPTQLNPYQHAKSYCNNSSIAKKQRLRSLVLTAHTGNFFQRLYKVLGFDCQYLLSCFNVLTSVLTKQQCNTLVWHHAYSLKQQANNTSETVDNENLNINLNWERRGNNGSVCVFMYVCVRMCVLEEGVWGCCARCCFNIPSKAKMNGLRSA